jgi:hypothetical protein
VTFFVMGGTKRSQMDALGTNTEKMQLAMDREKIKVLGDGNVLRQYWPGAPNGCDIIVPGPKGHWSYIIKIKDRLKAEGFTYNGEVKLWYRSSEPVQDGRIAGIAAFNVGGAIVVDAGDA